MEIVRLDNNLKKFVREEKEGTGAPFLKVFVKPEGSFGFHFLRIYLLKLETVKQGRA